MIPTPRRQDWRALLLVSSELSEILALSDRVLVMYEGRIVCERRVGSTGEREEHDGTKNRSWQGD